MATVDEALRPPVKRPTPPFPWRGCLLAVLAAVVLVLSYPFVVRVLQDYNWRHIKPQMNAALTELNPLLDALEAYHRDYGVYPKDLDGLVPHYLRSLPQLPPPFQYVVPSSMTLGSKEKGVCELMTGVPTKFSARTGLDKVLSFDILLYRSDGQYPPCFPSHIFHDRVGRWAYYFD